jgi:hypothetical protein
VAAPAILAVPVIGVGIVVAIGIVGAIVARRPMSVSPARLLPLLFFATVEAEGLQPATDVV